MSASKKPKTYHFHHEWEIEYFFVMVKDKCCCLICQSSVSIPKKGNLERHYKALHCCKYDRDFPPNSELRKLKLKELKSKLSGQQSILTKSTTHSNNVTMASFKVSNLIAKKFKPFSEGDFIKEVFLEIADNLFDEFKNKKEIKATIQDLQLSRKTVTRRVEDISTNLEQQLQKDTTDCVAFSLQLDESVDIGDTAQILIFIRMVFRDFSVKEELLGMVSLKGRTTGQDIFNAFYGFVGNISLELFKLVSITTDGAKAMIGCNNGFIALCRKNEDFPDFIAYHCIIHKQVLCSKRLNTGSIMDIVFKIVNSIRGKALQRRLFNLTLEEGKPQLVLYTEVRWLSRNKFLQRFRDLLNEIRLFLRERGDDYHHLEDEQWLCDLAFLADFTGTLSEMNLELQGKNKCIEEIISKVLSYRKKLQLMMDDLKDSDFSHFPNMQDHLESYPITNLQADKYVGEIDVVLKEFEARFVELEKIQDIVLYLACPFRPDIDIKKTAVILSENLGIGKLGLENEIINLQNDILIKVHQGDSSLWKLVCREKYPNLRRCSEMVQSCFGSTYLCESAFSCMNMIKSSQRASLTDKHLADSLRLALTNYAPDFQLLVDKMQSQTSH